MKVYIVTEKFIYHTKIIGVFEQARDADDLVESLGGLDPIGGLEDDFCISIHEVVK